MEQETTEPKQVPRKTKEELCDCIDRLGLHLNNENLGASDLLRVLHGILWLTAKQYPDLKPEIVLFVKDILLGICKEELEAEVSEFIKDCEAMNMDASDLN